MSDYKPKEQGFYWWRSGPDGHWLVVMWREGPLGWRVLFPGIMEQKTLEQQGGEWAPGPIWPPGYPEHTAATSVYQKDALAHQLAAQGAGPLTIVEQMIARHEKIMKKLADLKRLCPARYKLPNGRILVWHCPDELIPITEIHGE